MLPLTDQQPEEFFEAVQTEEATEILSKRRRGYHQRPLKFSNRNVFRGFVKRFYSDKKTEERTIGLRICQLVDAFHYEMSILKKSPDKEIGKEKKKYIDGIFKEVAQLRKVPRFVNDFPTFNSFWKYVKENEITVKELTESLDG